MGDEAKRGVKPLYCPRCGAELLAELLVFEDEVEPEAVLFIDCPRGDFHTAVTENDILEVAATEVMARLRQP